MGGAQALAAHAGATIAQLAGGAALSALPKLDIGALETAIEDAKVCRPTTRCPYESHQTCRPIGAHANNCSLPRTCQAEGVTPRLVSKAEAKLDQAVKRQATMGSRGMAGRMAGFVSSAVRTSGTTLVRVSGSHRDTFSGDADTQLRGWLKKNRSGKAFIKFVARRKDKIRLGDGHAYLLG